MTENWETGEQDPAVPDNLFTAKYVTYFPLQRVYVDPIYGQHAEPPIVVPVYLDDESLVPCVTSPTLDPTIQPALVQINEDMNLWTVDPTTQAGSFESMEIATPVTPNSDIDTPTATVETTNQVYENDQSPTRTTSSDMINQDDCEIAEEALLRRVSDLEAAEKDRENRDYRETLEINPQHRGDIIGVGGAVITEIRREHQHVHIEIADKDCRNPGEILLIGYQKQVQAAKNAILNIVKQSEKKTSTKVKGEHSRHGGAYHQINVAVRFPHGKKTNSVTISEVKKDVESATRRLHAISDDHMLDVGEQQVKKLLYRQPKGSSKIQDDRSKTKPSVVDISEATTADIGHVLNELNDPIFEKVESDLGDSRLDRGKRAVVAKVSPNGQKHGKDRQAKRLLPEATPVADLGSSKHKEDDHDHSDRKGFVVRNAPWSGSSRPKPPKWGPSLLGPKLSKS